ncbi:hypothetical protein [Blastococcus sp. TF02A-26]|uniref:hypothetical protein n=1 Tax=Blastococcus sp. TF02A-26 TaxID=2250577 RepID=UPI000DEB6A25|nr:hypothetical protein [Blastococcus sp. TF02A-26]RBY90561.1 hypothetical protein DQ240_00275 [Blastococcus sp. TF02A-26]
MAPVRRVLPALTVAGLLLTGCAGDGGADTAAGPSAPSSPGGGGTDLAPGLLPADAFGAGAQLRPLTEQQLRQGAAAVLGEASGAEISPPDCAAALQATEPVAARYEEVAGQAVTAGSTVTAEVLLSGGPPVDLDAVEAQLSACMQVRLTVPGRGSAAVAVTPLDLPPVGDRVLGLSVLTTTVAADGQDRTVPGLIAVVVDGDRVLTLFRTDTGGGSLDPAAFADLTGRAAATAADALD